MRSPSWFDWFSPERRRAREEDAKRELRDHLELEAESRLSPTGTQESARHSAHRMLGNETLIMEETRAAWGWSALDRLSQDIRFVQRTMRKNLGFSLLAAVVLALGIGANIAIFTVVNAALLQPLPFEDAGRLVQIFHLAPPNVQGGGTFGVAVGNFVEWRAQQHSFDGMGLYHFHGVNLTGGDRPDFLPGAEVSEDFFPVLRVKPFLGRTFAPEESQPGRNREIVLSYAAWQTYFGADRSVVGRTFNFDRQDYTVIGVMPESFRFPGWASVWVPAGWTAKDRANRNNHSATVVARLKSGVTIEQAQAEMDAISRHLAEVYPAEDAGWGAKVLSLQSNMVSGLRMTLFILLGAVGLVLLIACSNVANMVLGKTLSRRKEIAIRRALGSTRARVLQLVLVETIVLALCGGSAGILLARYGVDLLVAYLGGRLSHAIQVHLDTTVLLFAFTVSVFSGVLAGVVPALRFTRQDDDLQTALKQGLGRTDADAGRAGVRSALVVAEVAMCMVLLTGAGLLVRTLWSLESADPGFDPHHVVTMDLPRSGSSTESIAFINEVLRRVRGLPGVEAATAASNVPSSGSNESTWSIQVEGAPKLPISQQPDVPTDVVTPGFLSALRIPLLRGRDFSESDTADKPRVILVSESMARRFWPNQDAIGKRLFVSWTEADKPREVVGIVGDTRERGITDPRPMEQMYVPMGQAPFAANSILVRTAAGPGDTISAITRTVHEIDRQQPVVGAMTLDALIAASYSDRRSNMLLLSMFASLAMLLAAAGIYGVLSYSVRRRLREIGIRLAFGAGLGNVLAMVLSEGMRPVALGIAIGVAGALSLGRLIGSLLYGVRPTDPPTILVVAGMLAGIAFLACIVPAWRAARVQPLDVLRDE